MCTFCNNTDDIRDMEETYCGEEVVIPICITCAFGMFEEFAVGEWGESTE